MHLNKEEKELLEKWLDNQSFINWVRQSNEKDTAKWEEHFNINPHHWGLAKVAKILVRGVAFQEISIDSKEAEDALSNLMPHLQNKKSPKIRIRNKRDLHLKKSWLVAATITVLMAISGVIYFLFFHNAKVVLTTGYGQQLESKLLDGSIVTLNANSSLTYQSRNPRKVWLEGEAFFEIEKKSETNEFFQVNTQDLTITVLGTSFNVNARNGFTKVFLEEGEVKLEIDDPETDTIKMNPGDLIAYSNQSGFKEKRANVSVLENSSWKDGTLIFNDTPLHQALYKIEDIYGIRFEPLTEEVKKKVISGGVPIKDLKITLQTLNEVYGFKIRPEGNRYFISSKE